MVDRVGQQLGNYQLIRLLGEGGFAEVYLGEHIHLGTEAAIKVLHTQLTKEDVDQFRNEARTIARLKHRHIVRVLDFGVEDKTPFLVMDYASNGTLRQRHPKGSILPLVSVVSYVKQVATALQYAHEQKLIHRDIKPENMLLETNNDILLSDFGIALVAQSSRYQNTQDVVGTVAYMSPEQIQGKPRPASDQYSLAIVAYEWLSGDRPFHGSFTEMCTQHMFAPPPPLRDKIPTILPDVEQVLMTALSKDPHQRFMTVEAFARALEQAAQGEFPTVLISPSTSQPSLPPTMVVPLPAQQYQSSLPPTMAVPYPTKVSQKAGTSLSTYKGHAGTILTLAWSPDGSRIASAGEDESIQVWDAFTCLHIYTYTSHSAPVNAIAWSPDGRRMASTSTSTNRMVHVWDTNTRDIRVFYRGHSKEVNAVAWSPEGSCIATGGNDKTVHIWNPANGEKINLYPYQGGAVKAVAWSPDGKRIASGGDDMRVSIWYTSSRNSSIVSLSHSARVKGVSWSPDGQYVVTASNAKRVDVWNTATGESVFIYTSHSAPVRAVAWAPDGKRIASASDDSTVHIWDMTTGNNSIIYRGHSAPLRTLAWSPDGNRIASGGLDKVVQIWQTM